jgi:hypothetical protein
MKDAVKDMPERHPVLSPSGIARRSIINDPEDQATSAICIAAADSGGVSHAGA